MTLLLVMAGAAVGAPSRWLLERFVVARYGGPFPLGTALINVLGSLLLGVLLGASAPASMVALLGTGFCGGFTTFSTFGLETLLLVEQGDTRRAVLYVGSSVAAGLLAAIGGWYLGSALA